MWGPGAAREQVVALTTNLQEEGGVLAVCFVEGCMAKL